jgi:peptide/nickel transport system ATP-binding protein/oligopeptide transport system ATP-binding protein
MTPLLDIHNLVTVFDTEKGRIRAVDGVSLQVNVGETLGIVGESGCGKTVLSLSVMRLLPANGRMISGQIIFDGTDLLKISEEEMRARRGAELAMVFQEPMTSLNPVFRVGDQIDEAIRLHQKVSAKQAREMSVELLREVGISDPQKRARDYPHNLSGGMRQRVMIAMAMSCRPKLLLADEPTTALDVTIQAQILELMENLKSKNRMTVVLITHDLGVVAQAAQKVAVMYAGKIVETASVENLYTKGLLESIPAACAQGPDQKRRLKTIPGSVPDLYHIPPGCHFSDRCAYCFERCLQEEPALTEIHSGHQAACWKALEGGR